MASTEIPTLDDIMAQPGWKDLTSEQKVQTRVRYFEKFVQSSPRYKNAKSLAERVSIENEYLGAGTQAAPMIESLPVPTPTPAPSGPLPTPLPGTDEWRSGIARPGGIMGALAHEREPGGMLSNEALATEAGLAMVGIPPGARLAARTGKRLLGGAVGGAVGALSEFLRPSQPGPESLGQLGEAALEGAGRGGLTAAGGGMLSDALSAIGRRILRPRGPLSSEQAAAAADRQAAGLLPKVSAIRGSQRAAQMENIPRTVPFKSGITEARLKAEKIAEQKSLLDMAERISPGATRDFEEVAAVMRQGFTRESEKTRIAANQLFERTKDVMRAASPNGRFRASALEDVAGAVVQRETPMESMAFGTLGKARPFQPPPPKPLEPLNLVDEFGRPLQSTMAPKARRQLQEETRRFLELEQYEPGKTYSFPELLDLSQRLGRAVAGQQKNYSARAELTHMWRAVNDDLRAAAETAGAPEAIQLLDTAKEYYKAHIIEVFRNAKVLRTMVKLDPSEAAKTLLPPSTTVEQLRRVRRSIGEQDFKTIQGAWLKDLAERRAVTPEGEFDADTFLREIVGKNGYSDAQLKELTGKSYGEFKTFLRAIQRQERNVIGGEKYSLANAQMGTIAAAVGAMLYGRPGAAAIGAGAALLPAELISRAMYTPTGIRWLTVGLGAEPGSPKFIRAVAKLAPLISKAGSQAAALYSTRPIPEGESGTNIQRLTGISAP